MKRVLQVMLTTAFAAGLLMNVAAKARTVSTPAVSAVDDKNKDNDKQSGGNTSNSGGKNDGGTGNYDPPAKSGGGSTQHDNPPSDGPKKSGS